MTSQEKSKEKHQERIGKPKLRFQLFPKFEKFEFGEQGVVISRYGDPVMVNLLALETSKLQEFKDVYLGVLFVELSPSQPQDVALFKSISAYTAKKTGQEQQTDEKFKKKAVVFGQIVYTIKETSKTLELLRVQCSPLLFVLSGNKTPAVKIKQSLETYLILELLRHFRTTDKMPRPVVYTVPVQPDDSFLPISSKEDSILKFDPTAKYAPDGAPNCLLKDEIAYIYGNMNPSVGIYPRQGQSVSGTFYEFLSNPYLQITRSMGSLRFSPRVQKAPPALLFVLENDINKMPQNWRNPKVERDIDEVLSHVDRIHSQSFTENEDFEQFIVQSRNALFLASLSRDRMLPV